MVEGPVVRDRQQLVMAERRPVPAYSRVVYVPTAGIIGGATDWRVSGPVGDRVWLLGVWFWWDHIAVAAPYTVEWYLFAAERRPGSSAEAQECEAILQFGSGTAGARVIECEKSGWRWFRMQRLFEGERRVFGVWVRNMGAGNVVAYSAFEISEG